MDATPKSVSDIVPHEEGNDKVDVSVKLGKDYAAADLEATDDIADEEMEAEQNKVSPKQEVKARELNPICLVALVAWVKRAVWNRRRTCGSTSHEAELAEYSR